MDIYLAIEIVIKLNNTLSRYSFDLLEPLNPIYKNKNFLKLV